MSDHDGDPVLERTAGETAASTVIRDRQAERRRQPDRRVPPVASPDTSDPRGPADEQDSPGSWTATLSGVAIVLPGLAGVSAVSLFLAGRTWTGFVNSDGSRSFVFGSLIGLALWLLIALPLRSLSTARGGNRCAWCEFEPQRAVLQSRYARLAPHGRVGPLGEAERSLATVDEYLGHSSQPGDWIWATGYVTLWRDLHRADEALIEALAGDDDALIANAVYDYRRIEGSTIPGDRELLQLLISASNAVVPDTFPPLTTGMTVSTPGPKVSKSAAPRVLSEVRRSVNEFRDDARSGLVRARNQLAFTIAMTGTLVWLLIGLALLSGASRSSLAAASAFFLVAAVVGLFRQLQLASARDTITEEDFGLAAIRLLHAPVFSGIAGVAGVVVTRLGTSGDTTLGQIFNLGGQQLGLLVIAAVFGLTPTLLIANLHSKAESYKNDLKTSKSSQAPTTQTAP